MDEGGKMKDESEHRDLRPLDDRHLRFNPQSAIALTPAVRERSGLRSPDSR
jgi:hypothetical protein